jgi:hypothetical protein
VTGRAPLAVRWTVGDVTDEGLQALRLSIAGAARIFDPGTRYVVYVNTRGVDEVRERTGAVPANVEWRSAGRADLAPFLARHFDGRMAEGVGWKLVPLRSFHDGHELALDNDCILWTMPPAIERWLAGGMDACVVAEDVRACFGQFAPLCGNEPRNSGIRGVAAGFDLEAALREVLCRRPVTLESETDEQGLQIAALSLWREPLLVSTDAVTICSPFYTHQQHLGECGAHFVGLNAHRMPWDYYGRPAVECLREHWAQLRPCIEARVGLAPGASAFD